MSSSSEYNSTEIFSDEEVQIEEQSSQIILENNSKEDSKSEGSSLHLVVVESFYTRFPTPHNFKSPYFSKMNFKGPVDTLTFINSWIHLSKIHNNILSFPDLARDPIYNYTFINGYLFPSLQWCIENSIIEHYAFQWNQYALELHYSINKLSPYILQCILEQEPSTPPLPWTPAQRSTSSGKISTHHHQTTWMTITTSIPFHQTFRNVVK